MTCGIRILQIEPEDEAVVLGIDPVLETSRIGAALSSDKWSYIPGTHSSVILLAT